MSTKVAALPNQIQISYKYNYFILKYEYFHFIFEHQNDRHNAAASDWTRQENGYFRWRNESGDYLDKNGKVVPTNDPDFQVKTHIPYEGLPKGR
ncbi:hypothetical protein [Taibaiella koreensis]|uniref:hypothetical protein n=1 Tax=Taibaiella koreensis TaxID=1268548 RepID=UPI0013C3011C|nr:hypothetical protein [Taibaiella koreensis]